MRLKSTHLKLAIMGIAMMGLLTACFRQADTEPIQPQSLDSQPQSQPTIAILEPDLNPTEEEEAGEASATDSAPEVIIVEPTAEDDATGSGALPNDPLATPTIIIIVPATRAPNATPTPFENNVQGFVATATTVQIITPEAPAQLSFPTATVVGENAETNAESGAESGTGTGNGLVTPTDLPLQANEACTYTVERGNTLFRIAINNNVTLAALLAANDLTENSVIQPGQVLILPDCTDQGLNPTSTVASPVVVGTPGPANTTRHIVASGETLGSIARQYGVTIADIVAANQLSNPNQISVNQELIIPLQP